MQRMISIEVAFSLLKFKRFVTDCVKVKWERKQSVNENVFQSLCWVISFVGCLRCHRHSIVAKRREGNSIKVANWGNSGIRIEREKCSSLKWNKCFFVCKTYWKYRFVSDRICRNFIRSKRTVEWRSCSTYGCQSLHLATRKSNLVFCEKEIIVFSYFSFVWIF